MAATGGDRADATCQAPDVHREAAVHRAAVAELGIATPESDYKAESAATAVAGMPASFFADGRFDPHAAMSYLRALPIRAAAADLEAFAARNG